jgi:L-lactate dehydrogenase complex protein LldG
MNTGEDTRRSILEAVRKSRPPGEHPLPPVPRFAQGDHETALEMFTRNLEDMAGVVFDGDTSGDWLSAVRKSVGATGIVCSAVPEVPSELELSTVARPRDLNDVDIAVVRAVFGVAEIGSVLLTEAELQVNAVAYLAQHLVVLLDPADIVNSMHDAYDRREVLDFNYSVFHTGPSGTGDIEGVLIHGAQGVFSVTVVLLPKPTV